MGRNYKNLICYQRSITLSIEVVKLARKIRPFRLGEQIASSSFSVPSNIAEGASGDSVASYANYLRIAKSSCAELETQLKVLRHVYKEHSESFFILEKEAGEVFKMVYKLHEEVKSWLQEEK
ncbi:MAG: four helix bundle protein [Flavobacteriia bacterium]|nr:four helix bundle protein [Flavobacteriia bacterium]